MVGSGVAGVGLLAHRIPPTWTAIIQSMESSSSSPDSRLDRVETVQKLPSEHCSGDGAGGLRLVQPAQRLIIGYNSSKGAVSARASRLKSRNDSATEQSAPSAIKYLMTVRSWS